VVLHIDLPTIAPPPPPVSPTGGEFDVVQVVSPPVSATPETNRGWLMAVLGIAGLLLLLTLSAGCVVVCLLVNRR